MAFKQLNFEEVLEKTGRLLGSQKEFLEFPQPRHIDLRNPTTVFLISFTGGWSSGKTRSGILKGLMLSATYPGNQGMILRYHGKDLEESVIPLFFEVCPESWIRRVSNRGKTGMVVQLINGSIIYFRHWHDAGGGATKTRRVGANLGWFLVDQGEEGTLEHFNSMMGRLRHPKAGIKLGMVTANPNGRDWNQKLFFPNPRPIDITAGTFFNVYQRGNLFGIHVDSEENRESNGGFVSDDYINNLVSNMSQDWIDRYIHGSFEDFSGKVYKGYTLESVHNIDEFAIPSHWEFIGGIDVGGSSPWAVVPTYVDEEGNLIVAPGFHKATGRTSEVVDWIKTFTPWNEMRSMFVIDPENQVAKVELGDAGIICRTADKAVHAGTLRTIGYFQPRKGYLPPTWFIESQPEWAVERILKEGCPRIFVMKTATTWRREHDECVWDEKIANHIKKTNTARYDTCDATRYVIMTRPEASIKPPVNEKIQRLRQLDPLSAKEAEAFDRRIEQYNSSRGGRSLAEAFYDGDRDYRSAQDGGRKWDWN